jgi:hypothetical protein
MHALGVIDSFSLFFFLFAIDFEKKQKKVVSRTDAEMFVIFNEETTIDDWAFFFFKKEK